MANNSKQAVLVTGGAIRIGRAFCLHLVKMGYAVAIHYNNSQTKAEELAQELCIAGGSVATLAGDLQHPETPAKLVEKTHAAFGNCTGLINNAALFDRDEMTNATARGWDDHMNVNARAPFFLAQALAKKLGSEAKGWVVNMLDQRVFNPTPHFMTYTASKCVLQTLNTTLAQALAPRIRVNAIAPGPTIKSTNQTDEQFAKRCASAPLEIGSSEAELINALELIIKSPAMTGNTIIVDGGFHTGWAQPAK